jgi:hypothetical protein
MEDEIFEILDRCLDRIRGGETVEQCLADYPDHRLELEPLLETARTLSTAMGVSSSAEFRRTSPARLMSRIRSESVQSNQGREKTFDLSRLWHSLAFKTLVPVTLVVLVALIVWVALPVFTPSTVSAAEFTLSILSGSAEIKSADSSTWLTGNDGMNLKIGSHVRTPVDSSALLTFFDGSTTKLDPGADVLVSRSEYVNQRSSFIILEQQSGETWSYVLAGGEEKPYFAVQTPQGKAVAQGTAFSTKVNSSGQTKFAVAEGAIQVMGGDREIRLAANQEIQMGDQIAHPNPLPVPPVKDELIVFIGLPGIGSVQDPSGASTGYLPDGTTFNQITNSRAVISSAGQQILVEEPASGEYALVVRSIANEVVPISIQVKRNGEAVFQHTEKLAGTSQGSSPEGWIVRIKLDIAGEAAVSGDILSITPLADNTPEHVVSTGIDKKQPVSLSAEPGIANWNDTCDVCVNIANMTDFKAYQFSVSYDPVVLQVIGAEGDALGVTPGVIGSVVIPVDNWAYIPAGKAGTIRVLGHLSGNQSVSGWGYLVKIHFKVISRQHQTVNITFEDLVYNKLFDRRGAQFPAGSVTWSGAELDINAPVEDFK